MFTPGASRDECVWESKEEVQETDTQGGEGRRVQGYLVHKKLPPSRNSPLAYV